MNAPQSPRRFPLGWPDFTDSQRNVLEGKGLFAEQIEELKLALRTIRLQNNPPPRVVPVRQRLEATDKFLAGASRSLLELLQPFDTLHPNMPASAPPSARVLAAQEAEDHIVNATENPNILGDARDAIEAVRAAIYAACKELPVKRHRVAPWQAIKAIDNALRAGWRRHHGPDYPGGITRTKRLPVYDPPSVSTVGNFKEIISICYQAVGIYSSPDKAIRAYKRREDEIRRGVAQEVGFVYKPRTRGRPKKK